MQEKAEWALAHTRAHRTQTYWPSQANNKLIWAISALCGWKKQQDQIGAASFLRWGLCPPILLLCPSLSWRKEKGWGQEKDHKEEITEKRFVLLQKETVSCLDVLLTMNNNSVVWHGFHGYHPTGSPHPWWTSPPCLLFVSVKTPPVRHYASIQLCAQQDISGGGGSFPRVKYGEINA